MTTKRSRSQKPECLGKGKVTPMQVAFIVDRYLSDNNFTETRSVFRTEAAFLISKSPIQEAPNSLLTLPAMLDEYIHLKEEKVLVDHERIRLEQEKLRVQNLFIGMQDAMNAYNAGAVVPTPMIQGSVMKLTASAPQSESPRHGSPPAAVLAVSCPSATIVEHAATPATQNLMRKRTSSKALTGTTPAAKKSCLKLPSKQASKKGKRSSIAVIDQQSVQKSSRVVSSSHIHIPAAPRVQGSSLAKKLFNHSSQSPPTTNTSSPNTPLESLSPQHEKSTTPPAVSAASPPESLSHQNEKSTTPPAVSSASKTTGKNSLEVTPNCTIITAERVRVSPFKEVGYYTVERKHCNASPSPSKTNSKRMNIRDHVKGRLDFDNPDEPMYKDKETEHNKVLTYEHDKEIDLFDMDFPNLDALGENFSFSELLMDLGIDSSGLLLPSQQTAGSPADTASGSSDEILDVNMGTDQVISEFSSTLTEMTSGNEMQSQGTGAMQTVKSVTKCIRILSPAKDHKHFAASVEPLG